MKVSCQIAIVQMIRLEKGTWPSKRQGCKSCIAKIERNKQESQVKMSLVLGTGFEDVFYEHLNFRKSMLDSGKKLYESEHVFSVKERREPGQDAGSKI